MPSDQGGEIPRTEHFASERQHVIHVSIPVALRVAGNSSDEVDILAYPTEIERSDESVQKEVSLWASSLGCVAHSSGVFCACFLHRAERGKTHIRHGTT